MKLMMFSKHLLGKTMDEVGAIIKALGFEGVDLTVRSGGNVPPGHVLPENVTRDLPLAKRILADHGLALPLITTMITDSEAAYSRDVFATAAACGVGEIKLGYWLYREFGSFRRKMAHIQRKLDGIELLAHQTGVRANLHIHSDHFMTALAPVVWWLIKDRDPASIGAYIDPGHMLLEGGLGGWRMGMDLLGSRITLVAIKDFAWYPHADPQLGKPRMQAKVTPLPQGIVPWDEIVACLYGMDFHGWLSMHSEYQGSHSWKHLTEEEVIAQTKQDVQYLMRFLKARSRPPASSTQRKKSSPWR